ncbi:hypothetical protein DUNSADRAFT_14716, partial [Dunaliella salina]
TAVEAAKGAGTATEETASGQGPRVSTPWMVASCTLHQQHAQRQSDILLTGSQHAGVPKSSQQAQQARAALPANPDTTITEHQLDSSQRAQQQSGLVQQRQDGQPSAGQGTAKPNTVSNGNEGLAGSTPVPPKAEPSKGPAPKADSRVCAPSAVGVLLHPVHFGDISGTGSAGSESDAHWAKMGAPRATAAAGTDALPDDPRMKSILAR